MAPFFVVSQGNPKQHEFNSFGGPLKRQTHVLEVKLGPACKLPCCKPHLKPVALQTFDSSAVQVLNPEGTKDHICRLKGA